MRIYLPNESYEVSACMLSTKMLMQQLHCINNIAKYVSTLRGADAPGWRTPSYDKVDSIDIVPWQYNLGALVVLGRRISDEIQRRDIQDRKISSPQMLMNYRIRSKVIHNFNKIYDHLIITLNIEQDDPWWLGYEDFHARHLSCLLSRQESGQDVLNISDSRVFDYLEYHKIPRLRLINGTGNPGAGRYPLLIPLGSVGVFSEHHTDKVVTYAHNTTIRSWEGLTK